MSEVSEMTPIDCPHCGRHVLAIIQRPAHAAHLTITALTLGLWLPMWLVAVILSKTNRWCSNCGRKV